LVAGGTKSCSNHCLWSNLRQHRWGQGLWRVYQARSWLLQLHLGEDIWGQSKTVSHELKCNITMPSFTISETLTSGSCQQEKQIHIRSMFLWIMSVTPRESTHI
jgi:hypothetical protein